VAPSEARLTALSAAASVLLHAVVLVLAPGFREQPVEPPRVVSVLLLESSASVPTATLPPAPAPPPAEARRAMPAQRALTPPLREAPAPQSRTAAEARPDTPTPAPSSPEAEAVAAAPPSAAPPAAALPQGEAPVALSPPEYAAAYLNNPAPGYPRSARRAGEQGTVVLRVLVAADGSPARVEVERSSGSASLDSAALEAVQRWRFVPARRGAVPVEAWVKVPVVFRLTPDA